MPSVTGKDVPHRTQLAVLCSIISSSGSWATFLSSISVYAPFYRVEDVVSSSGRRTWDSWFGSSSTIRGHIGRNVGAS